MSIEYFSDTNALYIGLRPAESADAAEVAPDVVLDFDAEDSLIGVAIEHASQRVDLDSISLFCRTASRTSDLRGSVRRYDEPFNPATDSEDWSAA